MSNLLADFAVIRKIAERYKPSLKESKLWDRAVTGFMRQLGRVVMWALVVDT